MQLSTSLLPLDLPAANVGGTPVGTSMPILAEASADFSALLQAESTPLATTPRASDPIFAMPMPVDPDGSNELPLMDERPQQQSREDETSGATPEIAPDLLVQTAAQPMMVSPGIKPRSDDSRDGAGANSESTVTNGRAAEAEKPFITKIAPHASPGDAVHPQQGRRASVDATTDEARSIRTDLSSPRATRSDTASHRAPSSDTAPTSSVEAPFPRAATNDRETVSLEAARAPVANPNAAPAIDGKPVGADDGGVKRATAGAPASKPFLPNDSEDLTTRTQIPLEQTPRASAELRSSASKTPAPIPGADDLRTASVVANSAQAELRTSPGARETSKSPVSAIEATLPAQSAARIEKAETVVAANATEAAGASTQRARVLEAKFAVGSPRAVQSPFAAYNYSEKTSQVADNKVVKEESSSLGTNAANPDAHMPAAASLPLSAPNAVERLSQAVALLSFEFNPEDHSEPVELAQAARRAVSAAVAVTEQFAVERKPAVTLKFTVSGVDLGVHVELRGENVHTTFRTDSPELRAALAQEWNHVAAAQAGDRASRLAEPVFTSNHNTSSVSAHSNGSAQSDFGAADQRSFQQRQEHAAASEWARFRAASRASDATSTPTVVAASAPRATVSESTSRLRTFA